MEVEEGLETDLEHDTLQDCLVGHLTGLVLTQIEQSDGGPVRVPAGEDGELAQAELCLEGPRAVVEVSQAFPYPDIEEGNTRTDTLLSDLIISCCWYRTRALSTLNFLAIRNLTAEGHGSCK